MAQTKRKRRSKHRGTPAGTIESRGRTGRKPKDEERGKRNTGAKRDRFAKPPSWRGAMTRAGIAAGIFPVAVIGLFRPPHPGALPLSPLVFPLSIPPRV